MISRPSSSKVAARCTSFLRAVEAGHLAVAELEAVPVALRLIFELVAVDVHAAGGDLVQQRLPDVRARALDERDLAPCRLRAELVAEPRRELEPAGAAADDDDVMQARASATIDGRRHPARRPTWRRIVHAASCFGHARVSAVSSAVRYRASTRIEAAPIQLADLAAGRLLHVGDDLLRHRLDVLVGQRLGRGLQRHLDGERLLALGGQRCRPRTRRTP